MKASSIFRTVSAVGACLCLITGFGAASAQVSNCPFAVSGAAPARLSVDGLLQVRYAVGLRGTPLSYLRLAELFELPRDPAARECLVVVQHGQQRTGIVVDRFAGELQAVIKPLNPMLRNVPGLGGSTILGDGRVALILDINSLLATPRRVEHA